MAAIFERVDLNLWEYMYKRLHAEILGVFTVRVKHAGMRYIFVYVEYEQMVDLIICSFMKRIR